MIVSDDESSMYRGARVTEAQGIDQLPEVVLADVSRANLVGIDKRFRAEKAHQQLLLGHFKAEDADRQAFLQRDVLRDVQSERGLSHRGRAARMTRSPGWNPEVMRSRSVKPVATPVIISLSS